MHRILLCTTAVSLSATAAFAGGIERSALDTSILFEEGNKVELSLGYVMPEVDGVLGALNSGDVGGDYLNFGAAYKRQIDANWSWAIILNNPVGADVDYTNADAGYPIRGLTASVESLGLTTLVKYTTEQNVSFYGGLKYETLQGTVNDLLVDLDPGPGFVPGTYSLDTETSTELGYVLGVAWERPDIAARVALTYESARDHDLNGTETINGGGVGTNEFTTTLPQSVTLDFQSGVAADTLAFGSLKWTDWSEFNITPVVLNSPLVDYQEDVYALTLGVGRRFNENWAGAITVGYETGTGQPVGNLGPTEGQRSVGLGVTYTDGPFEITSGVRYVELGGGTTKAPIGAQFEDNSAIGVGVQVGYSF